MKQQPLTLTVRDPGSGTHTGHPPSPEPSEQPWEVQEVVSLPGQKEATGLEARHVCTQPPKYPPAPGPDCLPGTPSPAILRSHP